MQRDMFRRHFHQGYSITELENIERSKLSLEEQRVQQRQLLLAAHQRTTAAAAAITVAGKVTGEEGLTTREGDKHMLESSKNMFRKHYYQKQCESCYASKQANNQAALSYQQSMKDYLEKKEGPGDKVSLTIPIRPKQLPFVYNVSSSSSSSSGGSV